MRRFEQLRRLSESVLLTSLLGLAACQANIDGPGADGSGGATGGTGAVDGSDPRVCVPGIPATSQVRRLLNREYDAVLRDLLGVTTLAGAANQPPSSLLVPDYDGSLTDIAWNGYLVAARTIAAETMAGANRSRYLTCDPAADGCLTETIRAFGRKAFRRPLTEAEVGRFSTLISLEPQGTPDEIAEAILTAFLASPSFLTLPELQSEKEGEAFRLSQHEIATRLSFLLWGSIPDDALSAAADAGELSTKEQMLAQAQRMLGVREKSGPIVKAFHRFYADIRDGSHWATLDHDATLYPNYSPAVVEPMMAEIDAFFEEVAMNGGGFRDLFLSPVGFVSAVTAPLYDLPAASYGAELTRVDLDPTLRPGFLTRVGFLSSYSKYSATSPILRGAYLSERIIGVKIQAPPPGATDTPLPEGDYRTNREIVEALTSPPNCRGCHANFINPPGFVLERYDAVGTWQDTDRLGGPIDSSADVFVGGTDPVPMSAPLELMTALAGSPDVQRRYAELWVAFATGRDPNANDACVVDELGLKLGQTGFTLLQLLSDLTQADSFRLRTAAP